MRLYNLQRPHQGIEGLVPADRFFHAAPEVLRTLKARVAANALQLARQGLPRKPFYLTGQLDGKPFSVHREGDRVVLHQAGQPREDIELVPPPQPAPASEALPTPLCPDGSPTTAWSQLPEEPPPGTSAIDPRPSLAEQNRPAPSGDDPASSNPSDPSSQEGGQP